MSKISDAPAQVAQELKPHQIRLITKTGETITATISTANNKRRLAFAQVQSEMARMTLKMDEVADQIQKLHEAKKEAGDDEIALGIQTKIDTLFHEASQLQVQQIQLPIKQLQQVVNLPNIEADGESRKRPMEDIDWDECETAMIQRGLDFFSSPSNNSTFRSNS